MALLGLVTAAAPLRAAERDDIRELQDKIQSLEQNLSDLKQELATLEQKEKQRNEAEAAAAKTAPKITANEKGFSIASADNANVLNFHGIVQADSRWFFHDGGIPNNNTFLLRRARIAADGTLGKYYNFQVMPEFAGSSFSLLDANVTVVPSKALQFKLGRFKTPIGLEVLQTDPTLFFAERSLVNNVMPNRDVGVLAGGTVLDGRLTYVGGMINGVPDNSSSSNSDFKDDKDVVGRIFVEPFKNSDAAALRGLGVGVGGSFGRQQTASAKTSGYKTDAQEMFFTYKTAVVADGDVWRVSPQAYYYNGPVGIMAEYAVSAITVRPATGVNPRTGLEHKAWQAAAGYVLTGEDATYSGVTPSQPFDWTKGTWGAWEITARYAELKIDAKTFPLFADPSASASRANAVGLGLNWYLTKTVRTTVDYFQTHFQHPSPVSSFSNPVIKQDEKALVTRLQLNF